MNSRVVLNDKHSFLSYSDSSKPVFWICLRYIDVLFHTFYRNFGRAEDGNIVRYTGVIILRFRCRVPQKIGYEQDLFNTRLDFWLLFFSFLTNSRTIFTKRRQCEERSIVVGMAKVPTRGIGILVVKRFSFLLKL